MSFDREQARRSGFTLVELLVAVVMTGIFATVIFQLLQGQSKFADTQSARQEALQNTRGTLELIASELRAVPPGAITVAEQHRIAFRLPRVYGVLCNPLTPGAGTAWVVFPGGAFPADLTASNTQNWGLAVMGATPGTLAPMTVSTMGGAAGNPCVATNRVIPGTGTNPEANGAPGIRGFTYTALSGAGPTAADTAIMVFQPVEYQLGPSGVAALTGRWIMRRQGAGQLEPLSGPVIETGEGTAAETAIGGLRFRYLCGNVIRDPSAVTAGSIDAVRIIAAMRSNATGSSTRQTEVDSVTVYLRNTRNVCT